MSLWEDPTKGRRGISLHQLVQWLPRVWQAVVMVEGPLVVRHPGKNFVEQPRAYGDHNASVWKRNHWYREYKCKMMKMKS